LGNVVLRVIGERSYGLYLYHWPIFQAIRHETGIALKPHEFVVGILITVLVAEGSYRFIELPIREKRLRESLRSLLRGGPQAMQRRSSFAAIMACSLLLPIFAVVSLATADERPNEVQASLDAGDDAVTDVLDDLTPDISLSPSTSLAVEVPVTTTSFVPPHYPVFALGDSVMKGAAPALAELGIVVDAVQDRQGKMGADIFIQLQDLGVTMDAVVIPGFVEGLVSVQDEASQLVASLLPLATNLRVLDACAAPGGKTCALLEAEPTLQVLALDNEARRLPRITQNLERLGLYAEVRCADITRTPAAEYGHFDRILLDVPCSATGVIRRHPDIKVLRTPAEVENLVQKQRALLESAWPLLNAGGYLLYSTCSLLKAENSTQILQFLSAHADAEHIALEVAGTLACDAGIQLPPQTGGPDGFFYALLRKSLD
jgi:hypothetical protein